MGNGTSNSVYPFFNSIKSKEKFFFRMPHLSHFGFVSFWTFFDNCDTNTTKHNFSNSYQFICESALTFFDATLNQNIKSNNKLLSLNSQENNFAIYEKLDNSESTNLLNTFLQDNIDSAISTYKNHKSINFNNYNYNEEEISALGRTIIDYDLGASEKLFLFNREEYPDSWHVYFDLAFLYKIKGNIELAKTTLSKAQEIEPDNKDVKDLLKELENEE